MTWQEPWRAGRQTLPINPPGDERRGKNIQSAPILTPNQSHIGFLNTTMRSSHPKASVESMPQIKQL